MAIFIKDAKEVSDIYANIEGSSKRITSAWTNKDGVPTKIHDADDKGILVCVGDLLRCVSKNARSWKSLKVSSAAITSEITYGGDRFVTVGSAGSAYYSLDGVTWAAMSGLPDYTASGPAFSCRDVIYGKGVFVCLIRGYASSNQYTHHLYYSKDGVSWKTASASITGGIGHYYDALAYGDGTFVCLESSGYCYYSANGTSWSYITSSSSGLGSGRLYGIAYGNGKFVCVGTSGKSYYSTTGKTWKAMTGLDNVSYFDVTYGNGKFVCVGQNGSSYYSTDGLTWSPMTGLDGVSYFAVTYGQGRFVCVGDSGKSYYSKDGTSWTPMSGDTQNAILYDVAFNVDGGYDNTVV